MVYRRLYNFGVMFGCFSGAAAVCSGLVVLTGLMFPKQIIVPSKPFSHIIFLISVCDFLGSIGGSFGLPPRDSSRCKAQSFLMLFFYPASWVWTTLLVYQIRCLLIFKKLWLKPIHMHLFCWTIACLCAFLPLSTNTYGQDDTLSEIMPCNFSGNPLTGFVWGIASFACILIACTASMVLCVFHVIYHWSYHGKTVAGSKEYGIYKTTRLYPLAMVICWVPFLAIGVFTPVSDVHFTPRYALLLLLSSQYGTFLTIVFFNYCRVAVRQWRRFLGLPALENETNPNEGVETVTASHMQSAANTGSSHEKSSKFSVHEEYDDDRMLYLCSVNDPTVPEITMNDMFANNINNEFRISEYRDSDLRESDLRDSCCSDIEMFNGQNPAISIDTSRNAANNHNNNVFSSNDAGTLIDAGTEQT